MCHRWFRGDIEGSLKMQLDYLPLINALFSEVNPIPVKQALRIGENCLRISFEPAMDYVEKAAREKQA